MLIGVLFAVLAALCGVAVTRAARAPLSLAPLVGLAAMATLTTWSVAAGLPSLARTLLVLALALAGLAVGARSVWGKLPDARRIKLPLVLVSLALVAPALMLGLTLSGVEAPVSTHDGAYHVEIIDSLRHGVSIQTWYPMGFHASVAAVLELAPWLDSARGTFQTAEGLAILGPLAVLALGLALGLGINIASIGALILAVTWTYPYDYHLWAGWPQGMGVLLLAGLWATILYWFKRPNVGLALLAGLFAGALVITHGTDVFAAVLGLAVIALARVRSFNVGAFARHAPLAMVLAGLIVAPYVPTLLGWALHGGATGAGEEIVSYTITNPEAEGHGDLLQFVVGGTGAASLIDLPARLLLLGLGLSLRRTRLAAALWAAFMVLVLLVDFTDLEPVRRLFVITYPWLVDHRPRQVAVLFVSLIAAGGVTLISGYVLGLKRQLAAHPNAWRRLAAAVAILAFFFAEGSGVSIGKKLIASIAEQNAYSVDDAAAMNWLKLHAQPGDILANDLASDAGIWAPYKADLPILLPRSANGQQVDDREPILKHMLDLNDAPNAESRACALKVRYLFHGAAPQAFDERLFQDRLALEHAPYLEEVFSSGDATVFRVNLNCS